jgi:hypothetical protein
MKYVSATATGLVAPLSGAATADRVRAMVWVGVVVAVAGILSGCVIPSSTSSRSSSTVVAPAGSAVRDGKFEFQILGMTRSATAGNPSNPFEIVRAQGEFIILTMSVANIGNQPQSYFGLNQKLIDMSGRQYGANTEAATWMNADMTGDINPGNSVQVKEAFDVPPGTTPAQLEVHDSMFSGGANVQL